MQQWLFATDAMGVNEVDFGGSGIAVSEISANEVSLLLRQGEALGRSIARVGDDGDRFPPIIPRPQQKYHKFARACVRVLCACYLSQHPCQALGTYSTLVLPTPRGKCRICRVRPNDAWSFWAQLFPAVSFPPPWPRERYTNKASLLHFPNCVCGFALHRR